MKRVILHFDRLSPIAVKTLGSSLTRFSGLGLQFLSSIFIARQLGPAGFGLYGYIFTWATVIGAVFGLGLGQLSVREVPKYLALSEHRALRGFLIFWLIAILATGTAAAIVMAALDARNWLRFDVGWPLVLVLAFAHSVVIGLSSFLGGFQKILQAQFLESMFRQGLFLGAIVLCLVIGFELNASRVIQIAIICVVPVIFSMSVILHRSFSVAEGTLAGPIEFRSLTWLAASLPLMFASLTNQLQTSLDIMVLGSLVEDSLLGLYRAASRGADLAVIAQDLAWVVLAPILSKTLAQGNRDEAQAQISQSAVISSIMGLSICLMLTFFSGAYLGLFGEAFKEAAPILLILVAAQMISILCGPAAMILILHHREKQVLFATLAGIALNFVLKLVFIPLFGAIGAALATLLAISVLKLSLLTLAVGETGFDPTLFTPIRRMLRK